MKVCWFALTVVAACSARPERSDPGPAPEPVVRVPEPIAPLYERVLPGGSDERPLIGPDGRLAVEARQWTRDGRYLGRHGWATNGQIRPLALIGTADAPLVVALAWGQAEKLSGSARAEGSESWLVVAPPDATRPSQMVPVDADLRDAAYTLSPNREAIAGAEGDVIVVRALPSLAVIARTPIAKTDEAPVACWVDPAHIAWTEIDPKGARLRTLALATSTVATAPLAAAAPLVCDPAGAAAAMQIGERVVMLDLATAATLATLPLPPSTPPANGGDDGTRTNLAIGQRGARLAVARAGTLAVYHRDGANLESLYQHALTAGDRAHLVFSTDGQHLAVAASSLVVLGPPAEAHRTIAPRLAFDLPAGFVVRPAPTSGDRTPWDWAQLAVPAGLTPGTSLLVDAVDEDRYADVTALALPRDELPGLPASEATDEQIAAFAKATMPQLFEQWTHAEIGTERDAEFTLRVGRTEGRPWFETREIWRDGCEPYDGYTRVVVDPEAVFVIRALVPPGGSIKGWLEKFFDLPFGHRVQTARRHGPSSGPC